MHVDRETDFTVQPTLRCCGISMCCLDLQHYPRRTKSTGTLIYHPSAATAMSSFSEAESENPEYAHLFYKEGTTPPIEWILAHADSPFLASGAQESSLVSENKKKKKKKVVENVILSLHQYKRHIYKVIDVVMRRCGNCW